MDARLTRRLSRHGDFVIEDLTEGRGSAAARWADLGR
jgi:hypothetical protein